MVISESNRWIRIDRIRPEDVDKAARISGIAKGGKGLYDSVFQRRETRLLFFWRRT